MKGLRPELPIRRILNLSQRSSLIHILTTWVKDGGVNRMRELQMCLGTDKVALSFLKEWKYRLG